MRTLMLLFACLPIFVSGQSWFPPEAEWYYTSTNPGTAGAGHIHVTVGMDTVIGGQPCQELRLVQVFGSGQPPWGSITTDQPSMFVIEEGGLVLLLDEETSTFDTLYNMAAVPGDRWGYPALPPMLDCAGPLAHFSVTDTGTVQLDGQMLRWLAVDLFEPIPWDTTMLVAVQDTIIEHMGTLNTFIDPQDRCRSQGDANIGGSLRCYSDAEIGYTHVDTWWPHGGSECAYLPNSISENSSVTFNISPNPSSGLLRIDMGGSVPRSSTLSAFDAHGSLIINHTLRDPRTTLDLSDLPAGPYMIQVRSSFGLQSAVWVKE